MLEILYSLTIWPLEILFEFIFAVARFVLKDNMVLSVLSLSIAVNVLTLPLYRRADKLQEDNKEKQIKMEPMIAHIKKTFKGDERFMMLQTYYRQNDHKPVHALRGSVSLFLQIPFFIAAYRFLSAMPAFNGRALGPIVNLARPDGLISIGTISVNVLPVLMTLINIVSGTIYTKGQPVKTKVQLYGIAAVFLILLYNSPSGLVLYWTFNNTFSLLKNIFDKIISKKTGNVIKKDNSKSAIVENTNNLAFWSGAIFLALFTGLYIPSSIIKSSPAEFVNIWNMSNPVRYMLYSGLLATGTFVIWFGIYYLLSENKHKAIIQKIVFAICIISVFNYTVLGSKLGLINTNLKYDKDSVFSDSRLKLINLGINILLLFIIYLLTSKVIKKHIKSVIMLGVFTTVVLVSVNTYSINKEYKAMLNMNDYSISEDISIPLSKTGQNVILLMMDRAMGTEFPYILNERPELIDAFDGFTYYPNTVSFGTHTLYGTPALFGGYEYTPDRINARDTELLSDKHNEALKVLPVLFEQNGFNVTVCDPPFAGFHWTSDLSIYDEYDNISAYITEGRFNTFSSGNDEQTDYLRKRNFFCNAVMRVCPLVAWGKIYDHGNYNTSDNMYNQVIDGISIAKGYNETFANSFCTLENLNEICTITSDDKNKFLMMANCSTHEPTLLQEPDYTIAFEVDNTMYDSDFISRYTINGVTMDMSTDYQVKSYHVNIASMIKIGEWFDWMRENGVYDNTRIIIVADHGYELNQFNLLLENGFDIEFSMPLLLMKDFNARGFNVSEEFMTNADGVSFAVGDIIDNPVNPFSGNLLDGHEKNAEETIVMGENNMFNPDYTEDIYKYNIGKWYKVHDDVRNPDNWEYIGEY